MCLISLLYVEAQGIVKFKSIYYLSEVWSCGTPCETFQGQGESWNQEIIKSVCSQFHSRMRLKQKIQQFQQHWYLSRSRWESFEKFCKEIASRTLKNDLHCHLDSKPWSPVIRQRHRRVYRGYFHSVWCQDEKQLLTWKMKVSRVPSLPFVFDSRPWAKYSH